MRRQCTSWSASRWPATVSRRAETSWFLKFELNTVNDQPHTTRCLVNRSLRVHRFVHILKWFVWDNETHVLKRGAFQRLQSISYMYPFSFVCTKQTWPKWTGRQVQIPWYGFFLKPQAVLSINSTSATSRRLPSLLHFFVSPFFQKVQLLTPTVLRFAETRFVHIYIGAYTTPSTLFAPFA